MSQTMSSPAYSEKITELMELPEAPPTPAAMPPPDQTQVTDLAVHAERPLTVQEGKQLEDECGFVKYDSVLQRRLKEIGMAAHLDGIAQIETGAKMFTMQACMKAIQEVSNIMERVKSDKKKLQCATVLTKLISAAALDKASNAAAKAVENIQDNARFRRSVPKGAIMGPLTNVVTIPEQQKAG